MITADSDDLVRSLVREHSSESSARLHWIAVGSIGLNSSDLVHVTASLDSLGRIITGLGHDLVPKATDAHVTILSRPKEIELLTMIAKLRNPGRIVVFNPDADVTDMPDRCFDVITACIFDRDSRSIVRIFDPLKKGRRAHVGEYVTVEMFDHTDSSLSVHASRIASLRQGRD